MSTLKIFEMHPCWIWKYCLSCIFLSLVRLCHWSGWLFSSNRIWLNSCTRCTNYYCISAEHLEPRWGVRMCTRVPQACKNNHKVHVWWVNNAEKRRFRSSLHVGCCQACSTWMQTTAVVLSSARRPKPIVQSWPPRRTSGSVASRFTSRCRNGLRLIASAGNKSSECRCKRRIQVSPADSRWLTPDSYS